MGTPKDIGVRDVSVSYTDGAGRPAGWNKYFDVDEHEFSDPTPVEIPLGMSAPPTMAEMLQMYVRSELRNAGLGAEHESFEEANDFEIDDDVEPRSAYEYHQMHDDAFAKDLEKMRRDRYEKAHPKKGKKSSPLPENNRPEGDAATGGSGGEVVENPSDATLP